MKVLIVGRTASGKDTLREALERKYGWKFVKSYTTRRKRFEGEDTHLFVSQQQANSIKNKVAVTFVNNGNGWDEYFATEEQVQEADAYIVDPVGMYLLCASMPYEHFIVAYVKPVSTYLQFKHVMKRFDGFHPYKAIKRIVSENSEFVQFEKYMRCEGVKRVQVRIQVDVVNSYEPGWSDKSADQVQSYVKLSQKYERVVWLY